MAKPNYSFEKRQREAAKKKKKEEKLAKRKARNETGPAEDNAPAPTPADGDTAQRTD